MNFFDDAALTPAVPPQAHRHGSNLRIMVEGAQHATGNRDACPPPSIPVEPARNCGTGGGPLIEEHESDVEAAVRIDCPSVARHQGQSMLNGRRTDERVVHRSAGDAERS